jgi:hypothetical protein
MASIFSQEHWQQMTEIKLKLALVRNGYVGSIMKDNELAHG